MLKRRQRIQSRPTELQPVPSATNDNVGLKTELAAKGTSTAKLPGPVTETKQPWGTTVSSVEQDQEIWDKPGNQPTVMARLDAAGFAISNWPVLSYGTSQYPMPDL